MHIVFWFSLRVQIVVVFDSVMKTERVCFLTSFFIFFLLNFKFSFWALIEYDHPLSELILIAVVQKRTFYGIRGVYMSVFFWSTLHVRTTGSSLHCNSAKKRTFYEMRVVYTSVVFWSTLHARTTGSSLVHTCLVFEGDQWHR